MKRKLSIILSLVLLCSLLHAQEQYKTKSIYIQGGTANYGLNLGAGFEHLWGRSLNNSFLASINYQNLNRSFDSIGLIWKEQNVFLNIGYRRYIPVSNKFYPYLGVNVLGGYQHQGYGKADIYEHNPRKRFLYGAGANIGVEYRLNPISIFAEGAYMYDNLLLFSLGIKHYF